MQSEEVKLGNENGLQEPNCYEMKKNRIFALSPDEEIVISGMSGRFPNTENVAELSHNLYNKVREIAM